MQRRNVAYRSRAVTDSDLVASLVKGLEKLTDLLEGELLEVGLEDAEPEDLEREHDGEGNDKHDEHHAADGTSGLSTANRASDGGGADSADNHDDATDADNGHHDNLPDVVPEADTPAIGLDSKGNQRNEGKDYEDDRANLFGNKGTDKLKHDKDGVGDNTALEAAATAA